MELTYLKGTRHLNLHLKISNETQRLVHLFFQKKKHITGYSDADWAGDPVTRKVHLVLGAMLTNFS